VAAVADRATVLRPSVAADEVAARRTLREQIARLERAVADAHLATYPAIPFAPVTEPLAGPRLLTLGELERLRDALASHLRDVRAEATAIAERQEAARLIVEDMLLNPRAHKWERVIAAELGEQACKSYHVRPRLGLVGMLMGWWRVKISSGCPLAWAADGPSEPQAQRLAQAVALR
jgi:hypothetical protein